MEEKQLSFVNDLNPKKDLWNMKARIIRKWHQKYTLDLILIDEKGHQIQGTVKEHLIPHFDEKLHEDVVVVLSKFGVGSAKGDKYPVVKHDYKVNFYRCTVVNPAVGFKGHPYGFKFFPLKDILNNKADKELTVDVIGCVKWCGDMDIYKNEAKETKKLNFDIEDLEGTILRCTLWDKYAQDFNSFICNNKSGEHVITIIQHGKVKEWRRAISVQNGTRVFINEDMDDINDFRRRFILKQGGASTSQSKLSSQTCFPLYNEFVVNSSRKFVDEIREVPKGMSFVLLATIKIVEEEFGWFYPACRTCNKMVVTKAKYLEVATENLEVVEKAPSDTLWCKTCKCQVTSVIPRFKVQVRVQDSTGSISIVMFERDVHKLVGLSSNDIRERQLKVEETDKFPYELNRLVNKLLAFKIEIDGYNRDNTYHVYTVQKITDDPTILDELSKAGDDTNDEVIQEHGEIESVKLSESSQFVNQENSSKDVLSGFADSSQVEAENDTANSPNGKRSTKEMENEAIGELSTTSKRTRRVPIKLKE